MKKQRVDGEGIPNTVAGFKSSTQYIIESLLTRCDFVPANVKPCGLFQGNEQIYRRADVIQLKSASHWRNKFSRDISETERPLRVISREVGGIQRTIELFSHAQTEPLKNLVASVENGIPANEYGNVEIYRIPENASLVECSDISLAVRVCRGLDNLVWCKCQSGWKRKSPVFAGVVVLNSDVTRVHEAINEAYMQQLRSEHEAREKATMTLWRLLIRRMKAEWHIKSVLDATNR